MAFTSTISAKGVMGDVRYAMGTFTNTSGSTGGDIATGLTKCDILLLQHTGSTVVGNAPVVNEIFPGATGDPTIVTDSNEDGIWWAVEFR